MKRAIHKALGPWAARAGEIFDIVKKQRGY